jgi:hypothetical protein
MELKCISCSYRAQAVNPQIGREEYSAFIRLIVTGDASPEIAPEIVVKPKDMHIVKGEGAVDLQCLANARYAYKCIHIKQLNLNQAHFSFHSIKY